MGSNGTYPCPLCEILKDFTHAPMNKRALSRMRTFSGEMENFDDNMKSAVNRKLCKSVMFYYGCVLSYGSYVN